MTQTRGQTGLFSYRYVRMLFRGRGVKQALLKPVAGTAMHLPGSLSQRASLEAYDGRHGAAEHQICKLLSDRDRPRAWLTELDAALLCG